MPDFKRNDEWPPCLYQRGKTFWYNRMIDGQYIRESLKTKNEQDAIQLTNGLNYDVSRGINVVAQLKEEKKIAKNVKNTIYDLGLLFINEKVNDGLKKGSIKRYRGGINNFLDFIQEKGLSSSVVDLTPEIAFKYKIYRQDSLISKNGHENAKKQTGVKKKTLKDDITLIKAVFQLGVKLKWIKENPFNDVKPGKQGKKDFRFLTKEEIALFLNGAKDFDSKCNIQGRNWGELLYEIFYTYLKTGMRETELLVLEWSDIDFENRVISLKEKQFKEKRTIKLNKSVIDKFQEWFDKGLFPFHDTEVLKQFPRFQIQDTTDLMKLTEKNINWKKHLLTFEADREWSPKGNEGEIPITPSLLKLLKKMKLEREGFSNFVFPSEDGGMLRIQLRQKLIAIAKYCNIKDFTKLHSLRHTFATQLRKNGVPIETLKELLRHSDIRETMIYAHNEKEEGEKAIVKLDSIF